VLSGWMMGYTTVDMTSPTTPTPSTTGSTVLVTGGSGFVGSHVILQLLDAGHVASPIPAAASRTEDELIVPARDGVLRVLRPPVIPLLDSTRRATSANAQRLLGWQPRPPEEAIVATAESLIAFGVVPG
jgi:dihydroflavonol-4-reductase